MFPVWKPSQYFSGSRIFTWKNNHKYIYIYIHINQLVLSNDDEYHFKKVGHYIIGEYDYESIEYDDYDMIH